MFFLVDPGMHKAPGSTVPHRYGSSHAGSMAPGLIGHKMAGKEH